MRLALSLKDICTAKGVYLWNAIGRPLFRKENIYLTHISGHIFDKGYIYFSMVAATSMRKGVFILLEEQATSIPKKFIYSVSFAATSPSTRSCYFIGTLATSFQRNISTLWLLHDSRSSGQHRSFYCQRGYGKSVFACLVRGGDYSGSKKCPNVCMIWKDQLGVIC